MTESTKAFEADLTMIADTVLKDTPPPEFVDRAEWVHHYVKTTLDEMWDGETYRSADGTEFYHEIKGRYTRSGNPTTIS